MKHVKAKEVLEAYNDNDSKDSSLKVKWRIVLNRLKTSYSVKDGGDQSVDFTDLRIISKRTMEELEKKAVISEEEVNLEAIEGS